MEIRGFFELRTKTMSVETITDVNGAAAATQKNLGFLLLCAEQEKQKFEIITWKKLTDTSN